MWLRETLTGKAGQLTCNWLVLSIPEWCKLLTAIMAAAVIGFHYLHLLFRWLFR